MNSTNIGIIMKRKDARVQSRKLKGMTSTPTHLVPLNPYFLLKAKFQQVPKMLIQMGSPPRHPEIRLATASTLVSLVTSPKEPWLRYLLPLLQNSSRYRNCSKVTTMVMMMAEGMISIISVRRGCFKFCRSKIQKVQLTCSNQQISEQDLNLWLQFANTPNITIIPISGIFYNFLRTKNISTNSTIVIINVSTLKFRKIRFSTQNGLSIAFYDDIEKNASMFSIASGKNQAKCLYYSRQHDQDYSEDQTRVDTAWQAVKDRAQRMKRLPECKHYDTTKSYSIKELMSAIIVANHAKVEGSED